METIDLSLMDDDERRRALKKLFRRGKKYNNTVSTDEAGRTFDSAAERRRWCELELLARQGLIQDVVFHPVFELQPAFISSQGEKIRAITYEGDFSYTENGKLIVEDVKGVETQEFKLKWKLLQFRYPHLIARLSAVGKLRRVASERSRGASAGVSSRSRKKKSSSSGRRSSTNSRSRTGISRTTRPKR